MRKTCMLQQSPFHKTSLVTMLKMLYDIYDSNYLMPHPLCPKFRFPAASRLSDKARNPQQLSIHFLT